MKKVFSLMFIVVGTSLLSSAQDQPRWEFFGGYEYGRIDVHDAQNAIDLAAKNAGLAPLNLGNHINANGWNIALQENAANSVRLGLRYRCSLQQEGLESEPRIVAAAREHLYLAPETFGIYLHRRTSVYLSKELALPALCESSTGSRECAGKRQCAPE